jgi:selenocysteine lyase/cysteine desulfurase
MSRKITLQIKVLFGRNFKFWDISELVMIITSFKRTFLSINRFISIFQVVNTNIIYFDNAVTLWLKPEATARAVELCLRETGGSPGRSGHSLSIDEGRVILRS